MNLGGHRIHYLDEGKVDAPVLLFVHPGPGWSFTYRYHIESLRNRFRCVAPDMPGYGLSTASSDYHYTLQEQGRVLNAFVERLGLRRIIVWANDGGGPTAILGLGSLADRVEGLVVGGTFGWSLKDYPSVSRYLRLVSSGAFRFMNRYTNLLNRTLESRMSLGSRVLTKEEKRLWTRPLRAREARNRPLRLFGSFLDDDTQEKLNECLARFHAKSILVQFGEKDPMSAQGWHERWAKEIPNHRVYLLPKVKHFTFEDAPEPTLSNFLDWWATLSTAKSR